MYVYTVLCSYESVRSYVRMCITLTVMHVHTCNKQVLSTHPILQL